MSYIYPTEPSSTLYHVSNPTEPCHKSCVGYWAVIIILLVVAAVFIGLFIWALVKKDEEASRVDIPGAEITATNKGITANWSTLTDTGNTITIFASTTAIKLKNDGTLSDKDKGKVAFTSVTGTTTSVSLDVGKPYNSVTIKAETTYYVALAVTNETTVHYHIINDIVFTQSQSDIVNADIWIQSVQQKGGVSDTGSYTDSTDFGNFLYDTTNKFLTVVDEEDTLLCSLGGRLTPINYTSISSSGITYNIPSGTAITIPKSSCQWTYNPNGFNRWCLSTIDSAVAPFNRVCMARNNGSTVINLIGGNNTENKWANIKVFLDLESS